MSAAGGDAIPEAAPVEAVVRVRYELLLFVAGASDRSGRAIAHALALGDVHPEGVFELRVLDVLVDADAVRTHRVLAAPTLIKVEPLPERRFVGDLADAAKVLVALGVRADDAVETAR